MFKYLLPLFLLVPAWSADPVTPPTPPECLTRPVTLGNVTITCSLIDNTAPNGASALGPALVDAYFLQVRASSTDPDVIGFRLGVSFSAPISAPPPTVLPPPITLWGFTGKTFDSNNSSYYPAQPTSGFRYTFALSPDGTTKITGIQVQELKASSSQTF